MRADSLSVYESPFFRIKTGAISPFVLVVGDPFRTELVAKFCDDSKEVSWNREYRVINAVYKGVSITICSHGVGGPGAAICFEELIKLGAKAIIRLGTSGSLQPDRISTGDLVVSVGAGSEDGCMKYYVPKTFPAVSDPEIALLLKQTASKIEGCRVFSGITLTNALFHSGPGLLINDHLKKHADSGCLAVEMEVSALFIVASVRGVRAGAIHVVDGSPFNWEKEGYDPHAHKVEKGKRAMFVTGLETITSIANTFESS